MRIVEVINKITEDTGRDAQFDDLLTILVNLKSTAEASADPDAASIVPFTQLQAEMRNVGHSMDWETFKEFAQADQSDPGAIGPLDHLIRTSDEEKIILSIKGGEDVDFSNPANQQEPPQNVVDSMAKRALSKRI